MEVISEKLGAVGKLTKKGSTKKDAAALWKKFAAQLDVSKKPSANSAATAPQSPDLTQKSDGQLEFLKTVLSQTGTQRPTLSRGPENEQLRRPLNPIPHGHLVKGTHDPVEQTKVKEKHPGSERLDAMLQLLALNLDQTPAKRANATPPTKPNGTNPAAPITQALANPQTPSGKLEFDPSKLMNGRAAEVLQPGKGGNITQILQAMGIDPTQMATGAEPGVKAALAELRNRAEAKHSVALPEKKGRTRPFTEAVRARAARPRQEGLAVESVKVESRFERVKERLSADRSAPDDRTAAGEHGRSERRTNSLAAEALATAGPVPQAINKAVPEGDRFSKAIDRAATKIEQRYTEEQRRRLAAEPETATAKPKESARPEPSQNTRQAERSALPHMHIHDRQFENAPKDTNIKSGNFRVGAEPFPPAPVTPPTSNALDGVMPSPREAGPPQPMFSQIEAGLRHAFIVRPKSVTVRLAPEELGEIQIKVTIEQDKVQAQVQTESSKVASILKEHQSELQQRLQQQGIELSRFEVRQENQSTQGDGQRPQQDLQGGLDQQGQEGQRGSRHSDARGRAAIEREAAVRDGVPAGTVSTEPVSIFDANGRLSLTA